MYLPAEIENPVTGGRIVFDENASSEEALVMESWEPPHNSPPPAHYHPTTEEVFTVHEGHVVLEREGVTRRVGPGERITVGPGVVHRFWTEDEPAHFTAEVRPPGRWREFMTDFFALSHVTDLGGMGGFLQMVLFVEAYRDVAVLASPPRPVQRLLFPVLGAVARATGRRATYPYPDAGADRVEHDEMPTA